MYKRGSHEDVVFLWLYFEFKVCLKANKGAIVVERAYTDKTTKIYHSKNSIGMFQLYTKTIKYSLQ